MTDPGSDSDRLAGLAEEFAGRYRRGERPAVSEYADRYPELADRIRSLFPTLALMEQFGSVGGLAGDGPAAADGREVPRQLGDFRIVREVGRGGMGIVYEAVQESLGRHVALKVLPYHRLLQDSQCERFRREARAAARLHHTNIVPVFGVGESEGVHYFAMQFIRGQGLDRVLHELGHLRRGGRTDGGAVPRPAGSNGDTPRRAAETAGPPEAGPGGPGSAVSGDPSALGDQSAIAYARSVARIGVQVAEALAYAHAQGIVHRDIKPANLLLDTQGTVWIGDFGLVKEEGSEELTTQGDFVGTLRYMAPERLEGRSDPRSDVYGLGLTLYEMVTLRPAFADSDRARLAERVRHEEPPRPRKLDPSIPRDLETIVLKAIAKEPGRRYATAAAMAEDLRRFLADRPPEARRAASWERAWRWVRRNPWLAASSATAAVLLAVVAVGSVASAARLRTELRRTNDARRAERDARRDALDRLWRSDLARAQAGRFSGRPGQRLDSLVALENAARIARDLGVSGESLDELRNEAIACLALPDLRLSATSVALPPAASGLVFDDSYRRYALGDAKGTISVQSLGDERPAVRLPGLGRKLETLLISPDGKLVAGLSAGAFQVWVVDEGRAVFPRPVPALSLKLFSADSGRVTAVRPDGVIGIWDLRTGRETRSLRTGVVPKVVAISADGRRLAVSDWDRPGVVEVWDIESGGKMTELPAGDLGPVCGLAWHPDGRRLALGFRAPSGRAQVWDVAAGRVLATLEGHTEDVLLIAFHPGGGLLLTESHDATWRLWDAGTARQLVNWPATVTSAHFSRDGRVCGYFVVDGRARLVEVADGREYRTLVSSLGRGRGGYREGDLSADGLLAVAMDDGACLWDLATAREVAFLPIGRTDSVQFVSRPDDRELLTCGWSGLCRWPIREVPGAPGRLRIGPPRTVPLPVPPTRAYVRQDGRAVAVASERSGRALVVDLATEAVQCTLGPHPSLIRAVLSRDGRWVATSGWHTPSVKVWDARTGAMVKELQLGTINIASFSPDGETLATSWCDAYRFWDVPSWRPARRLPWEIPSYPGWVAFSLDRRLLALERSPAVIHLVDAATGRTLAKLEDPRSDRAQWLGFTPDGTRLVAIGTFSRAVHVWDLRAIRRHLAALDLDWESPRYPPAPGADVSRPLVAESLLGELSTTAGSAADRARRNIETYRLAVASHPDSASACNNLAWAYATAPEPLRDPSRALALARKAVGLSPRDPASRNTLGVACYRAGLYREAADTLRANLLGQQQKSLAMDLYVLAMSHQRLGETDLARAYITWAERHARSQGELDGEDLQELAGFRSEAEALLAR